MTPFCNIYSRFVDLVGVTVLYRQMAIDSVGVTALYIHSDLCFPYVSPELLRVSVRRPGLRFPAFLFMRGDPLL